MTTQQLQAKDAKVKAAHLKHTLYQRMVLDPTNTAKAADYKRGYIVRKGL